MRSRRAWTCGCFFFTTPRPPEIYTLSLHDALPISSRSVQTSARAAPPRSRASRTSPKTFAQIRSEEHTSELQSLTNLVCRLLLEKKKNASGLGNAALPPRELGAHPDRGGPTQAETA